MNRQFLVRPAQLNQAFESHSGPGSGVTRRSFIKRTGGATVGTFVAWNLAVEVAKAEQDYPYGDSASFLMVCMTAPENTSRTYDSGTQWAHGILSVSGLKAYFTAIGPQVGDTTQRGGTFQLSVDCNVQYKYGLSVASASNVATVNPKANQTVRFGGGGVEYDPPKISDPKTKVVDAGWFPSNSDGTLEGNVEWDEGHLELAGGFSGINISDFTAGAGSYTLTLPTLPPTDLHFKGILVWSFSIMTRQEYIDHFGVTP